MATSKDGHQPTATLLVACGCYLGLRVEEINMLRWQDFSLDATDPKTGVPRLVCHVTPHDGWQPKDGEARDIPVCTPLLATLQKHRRAEGLEGSRIDAKPLNFSVETELSRYRQGRRVLQVAPGPVVSETPWLDLIRAESNSEIARHLGITDRQVRRIKTGKVSSDCLREHAKADPKYNKKDDCRPCPTRARAAHFLLPMADLADGVWPIAA